MATYYVEHRQAVWETCSFPVEVPDGQDVCDYIVGSLDKLMAESIEGGSATLTYDDEPVEGVSSDLSIKDNDGVEVGDGDHDAE